MTPLPFARLLPTLFLSLALMCVSLAPAEAAPARLGLEDGLPMDRVNCVLQDRYGFVWVGTDRGLVRWDGHRLRYFEHDPAAEHTLPNNKVRVLFESRSGHLWVGTQAGLARLERESGTFRELRIAPAREAPGQAATPSSAEIFSAPRIVAFAEGEAGHQWVAVTQGVTFSGPGRPGWRSVSALEGLPVTALVLDGGGAWVGSTRGVARVTVGEEVEVTAEPLADGLHDITALAVDRSGQLWVGSLDGLVLLDVESRTSRRIDIAGPVKSLLASADGSLIWAGTDRGMVALTVGDTADAGAIRPRRLDGRSIRHLAQGQAGQVWAATDKGLFGLPPANAAFNLQSESPTVVFTGVKVNGRPLKPAAGTWLEQDLSTLEVLTLPSSSRMMTLELAALRFDSLEELRYAYRLVGFHEFWQETGADRPQAVYSSLPPGEYELEARAAVGATSWGEPSRLRLKIRPPRWQGAGAGALVLFIAAMIWWATQRMRRAKEERESAMAERLREMQEQKLESLATLAGGVAHDFNNLLVGIFGHAELAKISVGADSPAKTHLERILTSARRAAELSKQMLFYSGRAQFVVEPLNVGELVSEVAEDVRSTIDGKARLLVESDGSLPKIEGDSGQLRQVVSNLITNSVEALEGRDGFIVVGIRLIECEESFLAEIGLGDKLTPGSYISITVDDTAGGIEEESLDKIFDPFFSTKSPGRGLGLAAAQGIAQGHGGALRVSSVPGRGATFQCLLPAGNLNESSGSDLSPGGETERGQVLVVEADREVRGVAREYLEKLGFDVLEAADHGTALAIFNRHRYRLALVLLELQPSGGGLETWRELRRLEPALPIVLAGVLPTEKAHEQFKGEAPAAYLEKPLQLAHLQKAVRENIAGGPVN